MNLIGPGLGGKIDGGTGRQAKRSIIDVCFKVEFVDGVRGGDKAKPPKERFLDMTPSIRKLLIEERLPLEL